MILPTRVFGYKLLNNTNISSKKKQLIRATVATLTNENMTKQLKHVQDSSLNSVNNNDSQTQIQKTIIKGAGNKSVG